MGRENRLQEVLEETARVRAELGYPIMVTPFAQFVGSQAAINVIYRRALQGSDRSSRFNTRSVSGAKKAAIVWIQPLRRKFSIVRAPRD